MRHNNNNNNNADWVLCCAQSNSLSRWGIVYAPLMVVCFHVVRVFVQRKTYKCAWGGENSNKYIFSQHFLFISERKQWKCLLHTTIYLHVSRNSMYTFTTSCQCVKIIQIYYVVATLCDYPAYSIKALWQYLYLPLCEYIRLPLYSPLLLTFLRRARGV